jgi:hypothetical protein
METKEEHVKKIRADYKRSFVKKWGVTYFEEYQEISGYTVTPPVFKDGMEEIILKRGKPVYIFLGVFFIIMITIEAFTGRRLGVQNPNFVYGILGVVIVSISYIRRKVLFIINSHGIYYYKWDQFIEWGDVACCFIKTASDDSSDPAVSKELIIHYLSNRYHIFVYDTINLSSLGLDSKEVFEGIAYFHKKV